MKMESSTRHRRRTAVILFARYPAAGSVKTRLARALGDTLAAELYRCFIRDMYACVRSCTGKIRIYVHPAGQQVPFRNWLDTGADVFAQIGADLGERMSNAFSHTYRAGYDACLIIGTDLPDLEAAIVNGAIIALRDHGAVIGPSFDGGYYLIGFQNRVFTDSIFTDMPWSTDRVYDETIERLRKTRNSIHILPVWRDIDRVEDLRFLLNRTQDSSFTETCTGRWLLAHRRRLLRLLP